MVMFVVEKNLLNSIKNERENYMLISNNFLNLMKKQEEKLKNLINKNFFKLDKKNKEKNRSFIILYIGYIKDKISPKSSQKNGKENLILV